jgi:nucleoside-diphosphate-sugar epimerase
MRVLVIGGTLFIGRLLVRRLIEEGHHVAVLHRKASHDIPSEVENLAADRNDAESVKKAIGGRRFDAVFDNVYDWERGTTAEQVVATVRACGGGLQRYVFMSSVAAYGEGLNRGAEDPLAPDDHPILYCRHKASSERALLRLHAEEGLPAVTLRPPFVYGPENPFYREAFFWDRMEAGRPIVVPGDGSRLMQFIYVKDLVSVCLKAMTESAAAGQAFNVGNERPITQAEAVRALAEAARKEARLVFTPREQIEATGGSPMGPDRMYFGEYWDVPSITMQVEKARRLLGFEPTDLLTGLQETYEWYRKHGQRRRPDYSFEDQLLAGPPDRRL